MATRCKFVCVEVSIYTGVPQTHGAKLIPVYSNAEGSENKAFWLATPTGEFRVSGLKSQPFEVGKEYYLDSTEAAVPVPA